MAYDWVKVRVPGSVMLFGEHAVLAAEPAIVAAIAQYLSVRVEIRSDNLIDIRSNRFPPHQTTLKELEITKPYHFVLACLAQHRKILTKGLNIHIDSAIDPYLGLGSSAAVTVALLKALKHLYDLDIAIWAEACTIIRQIQGSGSGMDALASLHGGAVYYDPRAQQSLSLTPRTDLHLLYCGYKTPTATVLQQVQATFRNTPETLHSIYRAMGEIVLKAADAWQKNDRNSLGQCMHHYQELQRALQVTDTHSERLSKWLEERVGVEAVKISGAGLGDCLLALGGDWAEITESEIHALHRNAQYIPLIISQTGATLVE